MSRVKFCILFSIKHLKCFQLRRLLRPAAQAPPEESFAAFRQTKPESNIFLGCTLKISYVKGGAEGEAAKLKERISLFY